MDPVRVVWQGIHVCVEAHCDPCDACFVEDLPTGHALYLPYQVDVKKGLLFGEARAKEWLGEPLRESLMHPSNDVDVELVVERFSEVKHVVILNCIDFLYGHSLLKLLNAEHHITTSAGVGLIVIVPAFLRWMVPQGAAEVWTVNIPLSKAQSYYPSLHSKIERELNRFETVEVSCAHPHPKSFDISRFTGAKRHVFENKDFRITFIWREDRLWWPYRYNLLFRAAKRLLNTNLLLHWQNRKIRRLFSLLRSAIPDAVYTVAGFGRSTAFPRWIEDCRVERFSAESERKLCEIYAESRLVVGVHGSSMLLPSAHAGLTLDLMPLDRWPNFSQDILYQEEDSRLSSFRYRFLPLHVRPALVAAIAGMQIRGYAYFQKQMLNIV
jgi:hypothetical protein